MSKFKLIVLLLAALLFSACGSSDSSEETAIDLQDELRAKEFYVVEDSIQDKYMYKIFFDENLTTSEIEIYDGNYSSSPTDTLSNSIAVSKDSMTNLGGFTYKLNTKNSNYMNLVSTTNKLIALRLFSSSELAQEYYHTNLRDELIDKEFYVIQNDLEARSIFKITINEDLTQWDIYSYDNNYTNISGLATALPITVTDSNLTDSGSASFWLNTKDEDYIRLVSYGNSLVTLNFYSTADLAQSYYDSPDLRSELRDKTFYTIKDSSQSKQMYKLVFNSTLTQWEVNQYNSDFNQTAILSGTNIIEVTEDMLTETDGDILSLSNINNEYIELKSTTNSLITFKLYSSSDLALSYFNE